MADKPRELLIDEIEALAAQLEDLVATCGQLREENQALRLSEESLSAEKEDLISRNLEAKRRIDLVVDRLRAAKAS